MPAWNVDPGREWAPRVLRTRIMAEPHDAKWRSRCHELLPPSPSLAVGCSWVGSVMAFGGSRPISCGLRARSSGFYLDSPSDASRASRKCWRGSLEP